MSRKIFIIGASGFVGGILSRHFVAEGHQVMGLARSDRAASALKAAGIEAVRCVSMPTWPPRSLRRKRPT